MCTFNVIDLTNCMDSTESSAFEVDAVVGVVFFFLMFLFLMRSFLHSLLGLFQPLFYWCKKTVVYAILSVEWDSLLNSTEVILFLF